MKKSKYSKKCFYCPLSPYILWHHGLIYSECPLSPSQRDMGVCKKCKLNDNKSSVRRDKKQKNIPNIERREKGPIPNIGKTYTTE